MSTVRFATIDGRRVELTDDQVTWELRCDFCGEFISSPEHATATLRLAVGGVPVAPDAHRDLHIRCITRYDWGGAILAALRQHLVSAQPSMPGLPTLREQLTEVPTDG